MTILCHVLLLKLTSTSGHGPWFDNPDVVSTVCFQLWTDLLKLLQHGLTAGQIHRTVFYSYSITGKRSLERDRGSEGEGERKRERERGRETERGKEREEEREGERERGRERGRERNRE